MESTSCNKLRILELFSGIGGMHVAAIESGLQHEVVESFEINTTALEVYDYNFKNKLRGRNLMSLNVHEFEELCPDTILMSPPCQPFTRTGLKKDVDDIRTSPLLHILDLLTKVQNPPSMILLENVKGFETSKARDALIEVLKKRNYKWKEFLLSPNQFMVPNSRLRYYLLAKQNPASDVILSSNGEISEEFPYCVCHEDSIKEDDENCKLCKKCKLESVTKLWNKHFIDFKTIKKSNEENIKCYSLSHYIDSSVDINSFLLKQKILVKYGKLLDIVDENSERSCCFTKGYGHYIEGTGSVVQHNTDASVSHAFEEPLLEEEKLERLLNLELRYFSPNEILKLMCFPNWYKLPPSITTKQCYRVLGNSINCYVVASLLLILNSQ